MNILSIHTDTKTLSEYCHIQFNPETGKIYGYSEPDQDLAKWYKDNWNNTDVYPLVIGVVDMPYKDFDNLVKAKERIGGNYFANTAYLKTTQVNTEYESIFPSSIECDYTFQRYENGEAWPITSRPISINGKIGLRIECQKELPGDFTLKIRTKPEGNTDIEITTIPLGPAIDGIIDYTLNMATVDFKFYDSIELKVENPNTGYSYLRFKLM